MTIGAWGARSVIAGLETALRPRADALCVTRERRGRALQREQLLGDRRDVFEFELSAGDHQRLTPRRGAQVLHLPAVGDEDLSGDGGGAVTGEIAHHGRDMAWVQWVGTVGGFG